MKPGPARILTCPYCGANKKVLRLLSGNTFNQVIWSDYKTIAPMLPKVSFVQKCPSCGGFFLMSRQQLRYGEDYSFEKGDLSYRELKDAWYALKDSLDLTDDEKIEMLSMQVWAYNDEYTRENVIPIPLEEQQYIHNIIDDLIDLSNVDILLKAELLRETGRFNKSMDLLNDYSTESPLKTIFITMLKEQNLASNTRPFKIPTNNVGISLLMI